MAAIDVAIGMARIWYNVFSHISDGSYDDGAIHWVVESPMERGNVSNVYRVFCLKMRSNDIDLRS